MPDRIGLEMEMKMTNAQRIELEKRIVRGLIRHMKREGFVVSNVFDGMEHHFVKTEAQAMEAVFAVDEASLRFVPLASLLAYDKKAKVAKRPMQREPDDIWSRGGDWFPFEHGVLLILGEGGDVITDWNYNDKDRDGFNKAMEAYTEQEFA